MTKDWRETERNIVGEVHPYEALKGQAQTNFILEEIADRLNDIQKALGQKRTIPKPNILKRLWRTIIYGKNNNFGGKR